jgi:hypothetical protein
MGMKRTHFLPIIFGIYRKKRTCGADGPACTATQGREVQPSSKRPDRLLPAFPLSCKQSQCHLQIFNRRIIPLTAPEDVSTHNFHIRCCRLSDLELAAVAPIFYRQLAHRPILDKL